MKQQPFCLAPFFHSHVAANGANALCCVADNSKVESGHQQDLEADPKEFWNSDYIRNRRKMMAEGEAPPECHLCVRPHTHSVYKDTFFKVHFEKSYQALSLILTDDFTIGSTPHSVDYRNSVCNLQCQTCSPDSSTTLAAKMMSHETELKNHDVHFSIPNEPHARSKRTFAALNQFIQTGSVQHAYFAGGEPTLVPDHLRTIESLASHSNGKIRLSYNTNLMMKPQFLEKWVGYFSKFSEVQLYCSIDGVGELGEFIRMGVNLQTYEENLSFLLSKALPNLTVKLDVTLTSLGVFGFEALADFAIKHKVGMNVRVMIPSSANFMRVEFLDKKSRKQLCEQFRDYYQRLPDLHKSYVSNLYEVLEIVETAEEFSSHDMHRAMRAAQAYAQMYPDKPSFEDWLLRLKKEKLSRS